MFDLPIRADDRFADTAEQRLGLELFVQLPGDLTGGVGMMGRKEHERQVGASRERAASSADFLQSLRRRGDGRKGGNERHRGTL